MQFSRIAISKDEEVSLTRVDVHKYSKDAIGTSGVNPLPSLIDAVQAFMALFLRAVPALKVVEDSLRVTALNLGDDDGDRSVQVSAWLTIEACNNGGISMTTPRITIPPEGAKGDQIHLKPAELRLIEQVESEAERYVNGETAQGDVFASANASAVDEKMAEAEVATTRKPHDKKTRGAKKTVAPADDAPLSNGGLRSLLGTVDYNVPLAKIDAWTTEDRAEAQTWATACQQAMGKSETPPPACVERDADKPVQADDWTTAPPPKIDDVAAEKVRTAIETGVTPLHLN